MTDIQGPSTKRSLPFYFAMIFGVLGTTFVFVMAVIAIQNSTSSTAAIGYIFIVPFCAIAFFAFAGYGYLTGYVLQNLTTLREQNYWGWIRCLGSAAVVIFVGGYVGWYAIAGVQASQTVGMISQMDAKRVDEIYHEPQGSDPFGFAIYKLAAIVQNPNTSGEILDQIAHSNDPNLNEVLGSMFFDLNGHNRKGFSVIRLIAQNPNIDEKTINFLMTKKDDEILSDLAGNTKTPVKILWDLYKRDDNFINVQLAYNNASPPELLSELSKSFDTYTRIGVASNHVTPPDVLNNLLHDMNDLVRVNAKYNLKFRGYPVPENIY